MKLYNLVKPYTLERNKKDLTKDPKGINTYFFGNFVSLSKK